MTDNPEDPNNEEASLAGKGWDILMGGQSDLRDRAGADPFAAQEGEQVPADADMETSRLLTETREGVESSLAAGAEGLPPGAEFDQGRGAELTGASTGADIEAPVEPPRDISPEELAAVSVDDLQPDSVQTPAIFRDATPSDIDLQDLVTSFQPMSFAPASAADEPAPTNAKTDIPFDLTPEELDAMLEFEAEPEPIPPTPEPEVSMPVPDLETVAPDSGATPPPTDLNFDDLLTEPALTIDEDESGGILIDVPETVEDDSPPPLPDFSPGPPPPISIPAPRPPFGEEESPFEGDNVFIGGDIEDAVPVPPTAGNDIPPAPLPPWTIQSQRDAISRVLDDPFDGQRLRRGFRPRVDSPDLVPDPDLENLLITDERIARLWDEINETYDIVVNDVRGYFGITENALEDLKRARELLMAGRENYDNAEVLVMEVKARLRLEQKVRLWSKTRATWLGVYLVTWLLLLSLSSLFTSRLESFVTDTFVPEWMAATILPALFGALGGVTGALWVLIKHVAIRRDFDPIHSLWYIANPFMGGLLGVITYFVVRFGGVLFTSIAAEGGTVIEFQSSTVLYLLCIIVGFRQNVLWELIDRFMRTIFPSNDEDDSGSVSVPPPADNPLN